MLIKYIKSVLWRVAKRLSYIEDARCLKVVTFFLGMPDGNRRISMHSSLYYQRWQWACVKWERVTRKRGEVAYQCIWEGHFGGVGGVVVTLVNGTTRSNTGGYVEYEMGTYPLPLQNNHRKFTPSLFSPPRVIRTINYYYISLHCKAAATENTQDNKRSTWYNTVLRKLTMIHLFIKIHVFVESHIIRSTRFHSNSPNPIFLKSLVILGSCLNLGSRSSKYPVHMTQYFANQIVYCQNSIYPHPFSLSVWCYIEGGRNSK